MPIKFFIKNYVEPLFFVIFFITSMLTFSDLTNSIESKKSSTSKIVKI